MPAIAPPTIEDGDLTLRPPRPDDADAVTAACQDPEIQRWTLVPSPYRREDAVGWLAGCPGAARAGEVVTLLALLDGRLAGSFSLMELTRRPGYGEIGYWVAADARRRGVAGRAVTLLRDWGAGALRLRTIEILCHRDNLPSRAVALRAGFAETGELRALPRGSTPGDPPDHIVYRWRRDGTYDG